MTSKFQQRHYEAIAELVQEFRHISVDESLPTVPASCIRIDRIVAELALPH